MTESPEQAIPEEVMREARAAYEQIPLVYDGWDEEACILVIARALLSAEARGREAQREADARIAEAYAFDNAAIGEDWTVEFAPNERTVGSAIATAIRNA
jgi:hypothetical protein